LVRRPVGPPPQDQLAAPLGPLQIAVGAVLIQRGGDGFGVAAQRVRVVVLREIDQHRFHGTTGAVFQVQGVGRERVDGLRDRQRRRSRDRPGQKRRSNLGVLRRQHLTRQRAARVDRRGQFHPPSRIPRTDGQQMPQEIDIGLAAVGERQRSRPHLPQQCRFAHFQLTTRPLDRAQPAVQVALHRQARCKDQR